MRFATLILTLAVPALLCAQEVEISPDSSIARAAVERGEILPLSALLPRIRAAFPGEVLDIAIDLYPDGRIEEYEIEILTPEGRLIEVDVDAATGEITEVGDENPDDDEP